MATHPNKPRLDQYRVGSLLQFNAEDKKFAGVYLILRIDKLKKAPMTWAVHMWKVGSPEPKDIYDTAWQGAHAINEMLDSGMMSVVSY